jgi:hypothetical protein
MEFGAVMVLGNCGMDEAWGFSSAVSGGLAVAHQNNFYHDAQLDHLETKAESHRVLNPAILTAPR